MGRLNRKYFARAFWVGMIAAALGTFDDGTTPIIWTTLLETAAFLGLVSGLVWLYMKIAKKAAPEKPPQST